MTLGHFELVEQVGVGGFGSVWRARDVELDRTVAVKIPRKGQLSSAEMEQFLREARAAAQLDHPSIVSVHEVGRDGETLYIVSEFVHRLTLADWLTGRRMTCREAAELCAKIADALDHAHRSCVVRGLPSRRHAAGRSPPRRVSVSGHQPAGTPPPGGS
jgi:serine/threonine protein kinase